MLTNVVRAFLCGMAAVALFGCAMAPLQTASTDIPDGGPYVVLVAGSTSSLNEFWKTLDTQNTKCPLSRQSQEAIERGLFKQSGEAQLLYDCGQKADAESFVPFATALGKSVERGPALRFRIMRLLALQTYCVPNTCGTPWMKYWRSDAICRTAC